MLLSASATSVLDFLWECSSGEEVVVSMRSCLIMGLWSSPSSVLLEVVNGDDALRFGVDDAAPSTQRSLGAGNLHQNVGEGNRNISLIFNSKANIIENYRETNVEQMNTQKYDLLDTINVQTLSLTQFQQYL